MKTYARQSAHTTTLEHGGRNVISKVSRECKQVLDLSVVINNEMGTWSEPYFIHNRDTTSSSFISPSRLYVCDREMGKGTRAVLY